MDAETLDIPDNVSDISVHVGPAGLDVYLGIFRQDSLSLCVTYNYAD